MISKGTYTNFNGETVDFNYESELSLSQKASFVMEVAGMIVSSEVGYAYILKEAIFDYCLIKYFTDIVLFENEEDFSLDMIDHFTKINKESVIDTITKAMGEDDLKELWKACDEAIEFRKSHFSDYREEVSDLLQVVREFVVKPDYMNELLIAATNALNSFADKSDIDMSMVNKLADIIPIMKDMGNVEVAKAIIAEQNKDKPTEVNENKPKSNRGRKPKVKTENNIEVVK
ncbi:hypothetical protein [[Clostridium] scindens]|uniref:hypothetical protein n=1 Tax=Clostridium scindens (strain JCM 10418 / VPI 12708) TaxID=29347 RepID=UPI001D06BF45|nr:hypothetical protein [[Clostridium] scindens]MCB6286028.1 hypothetical protein [[Clostridium] scindens]MCB6421567.1 hypothetical protein [[Clostridium] scindens]MCB7192546.1 hypothetical protein [[Clostridium] scindens]MCB7285729.1 hypothetical protein [[Clostridium] scindens]MCG4929768.1 hypothetical protein [[Clostridium] scindens]